MKETIERLEAELEILALEKENPRHGDCKTNEILRNDYLVSINALKCVEEMKGFCEYLQEKWKENKTNQGEDYYAMSRQMLEIINSYEKREGRRI